MNSANSVPASPRLEELIRLWQGEHAELLRSIRETTLWIGQLCDQSASYCDDLVKHMEQFRERMLRHFDREDSLAKELHGVYGCVEAESTRRRAEGDHLHLTRRVDELLVKLHSPADGFASFQEAIQEISLFVDAVEQHEEEEAQGLEWLSSPCSESRPASEF